MKKIAWSFLFLLLSFNGYSQELIEVCEKTIKIKGLTDEVFYYGFADNDKIVFSLEEINGKEIKEVVISEYPENVKFSDFKTSKIKSKHIQVNSKNVYEFRIQNSSLAGRICKIKIQRIPFNENTKNFNTTVSRIDRQETSYTSNLKDVIIGYDTKYESKVRKELVKTDTLFIPLFDKNLRVHSQMAYGKSQYSNATIDLPRNVFMPNTSNPYQTTEVVAWSYWLGVGEKPKEQYNNTNKKIKLGITALGTITGYGALASLAATGISLFEIPEIGDNVNYKLYRVEDGKIIRIDDGNVVSASGRNDKITQGSFSVQLYNDNIMEGIDVNIKIIAMQIQKTWKDIQYQEKIETPIFEKQMVKEPIVKIVNVLTIQD